MKSPQKLTMMNNPSNGSCAVCHRAATKACSRCKHVKSVYYCSVSCQKSHFPLHKDACKAALRTPLPPPPPPPSTSKSCLKNSALPPTPPNIIPQVVKEYKEKHPLSALSQPMMFPPSDLKFTRQEIQESFNSPLCRTLRDALDAATDDLNAGLSSMSSSPALSTKLLGQASSRAASVLQDMDAHKPTDANIRSAAQHCIMNLFVDVSRVLCRAMCALGQLKEMQGSAREALLLYQASLPQCESLQDKTFASQCRVGIANCYRSLGENSKCVDLLTLELQTCEYGGDVDGQSLACNSLSKAYSSMPYDPNETSNNLATARDFAFRDVMLCRGVGADLESSDFDPCQLGSALSQLGTVQTLAGDVEEADATFTEAERCLEDGGDLPTLLLTLLAHCNLLLREGRENEAIGKSVGIARKAVEVARELGSRENEMTALALLMRGENGGSEMERRSFVKLLREFPPRSNGKSSPHGVLLDDEDATVLCPVCGEAADIMKARDAFTMIHICRHTAHTECMLQHVQADKLKCPVAGCGADFIRGVWDPRNVLRLANGENNCLNYL